MVDDIDIAEIQKLNESDPAKAELMLEMGRLLVEEFSERQPKRFKVIVETVMNGLPPRFKIQARLVHDSDWVAGICDDLEGEGPSPGTVLIQKVRQCTLFRGWTGHLGAGRVTTPNPKRKGENLPNRFRFKLHGTLAR